MLVHYIIVRRDLPLGTMAAMITHAAGESAALYTGNSDSTFYTGDDDYYTFMGSVAVVLGVDNVAQLLKTSRKLSECNIPYVGVRESSPPYDGAYMALGLVPIERDKVAGLLKDLQTLKTLILPDDVDDGA